MTVDYYNFNGESYQFDEMFEVEFDIDPNDPKYNKLIQIYPNGRQFIILKIEDIYDNLQNDVWINRNPTLPGHISVNKNSITKTTGNFTPGALRFLFDEFMSYLDIKDNQIAYSFKEKLEKII